MSQKRSARTRLKPEERVRQILAAAAQLVVEQGTFPISLETLGRRVGVSKALIYSYFPTQYDLANRLLAERLEAMAADLDRACSHDDWTAAARACAAVYFEDIATNGTLAHIVLSDLHVARHLDGRLKALYRRQMRRLAVRLRAATGLAAGETVAALNMLAAIAEESGSLVFLSRIDRQVGREIACAMVVGGIEGLAAAREAGFPAHAGGPTRQATAGHRPSASG